MAKLSNILSSLSMRGAGTTALAAARAIGAELDKRRGRRFIERGIFSYRMLLDLEDRGISRTLLLFGERELEHKVMLERILRPGMTVLDIGANIGYYALMELALIMPGGTLIAVEPSPSNVALLKRNLALNGYDGTEVYQAAISDRAAKRPFFMSEMSNLNTFHDTRTGSLHLKGETINVDTKTVPEIMAGRPLDLIRMDVEGHEVEVLSGLLPAVERDDVAPMIIFETHLSRYSSNHDMEPVLRRLFAKGYRVALAGSSSQRGTKIIEALGYAGLPPIKTDDVERVIFENLRNDDAIELICRTGGVRTVLLSPRGGAAA
jgi:FkbM family methyltransferase